MRMATNVASFNGIENFFAKHFPAGNDIIIEKAAFMPWEEVFFKHSWRFRITTSTFSLLPSFSGEKRLEKIMIIFAGK